MSSRYQHGYDYDVFVSYSTRDLAWVRPFHDDLVAEINRFANPDVEPFLDKPRLQPGYVWDDKLLAAVRDSAVFVPVLSPRFFQSEYCQKEVKAFLDTHGLSSGSAHRSRIMPVQLLSAASADHPLAKVQPMPFGREGDDGIPFEYQRGAPQYQEALRKLAYAIAQVIKTLPPKAQGRPAVYLAPDFRAESDKLRASLQHQFDVLPENPSMLPGLSQEDLQRALEGGFARCFASVHPLNDAPFAKPLVDAQLAFAAGQNKPRIAWTSGRRDDLATAGFELIKSQAEIEERLRRLIEKPPAAKPSGAERLIYFLCPDRANKTRAEPLLDELERLRVHLYPSPLEGPAEQAMQTHVEALDELDGCIIYYGDVDRAWFDAVFLRVRKKIRQRQLRSVIFHAPPPNADKTEILRSLGGMVVDSAEAAARVLLGDAA